MQSTLAAAVALNKCSSDCPFCSNPKLLGYKTKHGALKKETQLGKNMRASGMIANESTTNFSGDLYPLPGGNDRTIEWEAVPGVFESFAVRVPAAPHHLIPGQAAMRESRLEKWTCKSMSGSKIKEDIGYSIDCAQNGIFLPHLPEIYFTRHAPGTKIPSAKYYGQTWAGLSPGSKESIAFTIMNETGRQIHFMDHSTPYTSVDRDDDDDDNYDDECITRCNQLADLMEAMALKAECEDDNGELMPPYGLVGLINGKSAGMKMRISGPPQYWESWVSPFAEDFTVYMKHPEQRRSTQFLIRRLEEGSD